MAFYNAHILFYVISEWLDPGMSKQQRINNKFFVFRYHQYINQTEI